MQGYNGSVVLATTEILVKEVPNSIVGEEFVGFLGALTL